MRGRRAKAFLGGALLVCALVAGMLLASCEGTAAGEGAGGYSQQPSASVDSGSYDEAAVVRVVDGDTLIVRVDGGKEQRLRLVGINAPESVAEDEGRNCEEGRAASTYLKSVVGSGTKVWLQKDVSETDQYGRLLRYVWLEVPSDARDPREVADKMLNGLLVAEGYAEARRYPPDTAYQGIFHQLGEQAIGQKKGVSYYWS